MNAAAKELPVSYDLSKPQENKEPYVGSVLFFKHVIFTVTLLLILIPTTLSIYLFAQVRSLSRQLDTAGSQLAAMQEQLPSTAPEGGEPTPVEPEPPAAEVPAYTELYPELYADDSLRGTVDVDNAVYLTFDDGPSARTDEILEILDKYGVKATFFVVGANEEGDLERMQKIVAVGHTLAIHSYSHDYKKIYASVEAYLEDFNQMFCQIYEATGVKPLPRRQRQQLQCRHPPAAHRRNDAARLRLLRLERRQRRRRVLQNSALVDADGQRAQGRRHRAARHHPHARQQRQDYHRRGPACHHRGLS